MSIRWSRRWYRLPGPAPAPEELAERFGSSVQLLAGTDFAVTDEGDDVDCDQPRRVERDWKDLPEVIYFGVNGGVNLFAYSRWRHGELVRHIFYAGDGGWCRVQGEPEPWEAELLFGKEALERLAIFFGDDFPDEDAERIRGIYREHRLEQGAEFPLADAEALSWSIGLPG